MSWDLYHSRSERLAAEGGVAARSGNREVAEELYRKAAEAESEALDYVPRSKSRTLGITTVSAVALWYKGNELLRAEKLAHQRLASGELPEFAQVQIREPSRSYGRPSPPSERESGLFPVTSLCQ